MYYLRMCVLRMDVLDSTYHLISCKNLRVRHKSLAKPMVPCAENTPLPNRKQSKQQRAKLFSVYLRPWTLIATEATDAKPYIADLDEVKTTTESHRDMREAWKHYYTTGVAKPWAEQIMNFVRVTSAEGQASFLDDEEEKNSKMNAVTCPLSTTDITSLIKSAYSHLTSPKTKDTNDVTEQTVR